MVKLCLQRGGIPFWRTASLPLTAGQIIPNWRVAGVALKLAFVRPREWLAAALIPPSVERSPWPEIAEDMEDRSERNRAMTSVNGRRAQGQGGAPDGWRSFAAGTVAPFDIARAYEAAATEPSRDRKKKGVGRVMDGNQAELRAGQWYLCPTKRGKEVVARNALEGAGVEVFLPLIYERPEHKPEPLFPHYIFLRLDSPARLRTIRMLAGMRDDVIAQRSTVEVPESIVESLKAALEERTRGVKSELPSEPIREMVDRRIASLERSVRLLKIIEQHKAAEARAKAPSA
jgi:transcription antitermination factor NusG